MSSSTIEKKSKPESPSIWSHIQFEHLAAGLSGGVVSSFVLHPLDLIKVRFQVDEGPSHGAVKRPSYTGINHAFRSIVQTDGWRGLYRGVTPNVTGAGLSWGLYFFAYNATKRWMQDGDTNKDLGAGNHMLIASAAGLFTLTLTNPIWVSKTRMCLHYDVPGKVHFVGMWETLWGVYKMEGVRGLYRGYVPSLFGISHGALQFMAYEEMKNGYNRYKNQPLDTRLSSLEYLLFAAISKMFAATFTYPYQVVRSRLQDQHRHYDGSLDVVKQIWRKESLRGMFKGLSPYMLHIVPNIMLVFGVYEAVLTLHKEMDPLGRFEGPRGYFKGLAPNLLRVTPACAITFLVYESIISRLQGPKGDKPATTTKGDNPTTSTSAQQQEEGNKKEDNS